MKNKFIFYQFWDDALVRVAFIAKARLRIMYLIGFLDRSICRSLYRPKVDRYKYSVDVKTRGGGGGGGGLPYEMDGDARRLA